MVTEKTPQYMQGTLFIVDPEYRVKNGAVNIDSFNNETKKPAETINADDNSLPEREQGISTPYFERQLEELQAWAHLSSLEGLKKSSKTEKGINKLREASPLHYEEDLERSMSHKESMPTEIRGIISQKIGSSALIGYEGLSKEDVDQFVSEAYADSKQKWAGAENSIVRTKKIKSLKKYIQTVRAE